MWSFVSAVSATDWSLPGITIITRKQWGADENLRIKGVYDMNTMYPSQNTKDLQGSNYDSFIDDQKNLFLENQRKLYLMKYYSGESFINYTLTGINNTISLIWPQSYHYQKTKIVIHHTAKDTSTFTGITSVVSYIQDVYGSHARKWGDIGYNFLIDSYGNIYEGRSWGEGVIGAHAIRNNTPTIGIALIWNFELILPTTSQINSLTALLTSLTKKYTINPLKMVDYHKGISEYPYIETSSHPSIAGHKDMWDTECPGKYLYDQLPQIIQKVWLNFNNPYWRDTFKYIGSKQNNIRKSYLYIFQ